MVRGWLDAILRLLGLRRGRPRRRSPFRSPTWSDVGYFEAEDEKGRKTDRSFTSVPSAAIVRVTLPWLFDKPHHRLFDLQCEVASVVLGYVELSYMPGRFLALLREHDAFQAVSVYLAALGVDFQRLLWDLRTREFVKFGTSLLAEVEFVRRRARLDDAPIYEAIRSRDRSRLVDLAKRLEMLSDMVVAIEEAHITLPGFEEELRDRLRTRIRRWATLDYDVLREVAENLAAWKYLQSEYDKAVSRCTRVVRDLREVAIRLGDMGLQEALGGFVASIGTVEEGVRARELEAADAIDELRRIQADLERVASAYDYEPESADPATSTEEEVHDSLTRMGLRYPDDLMRGKIQKRFRELAREYHPDKGGSDEEMRQLIKSRSILLRFLEDRGE